MKNSARLTLLSVAAVLVFTGNAHAATFSRDILNDGSMVSLFAVDAAATPDGKIHVVAQGTLVAAIGDINAKQIYYMLYNSSGTELIGPTIINTGAVSRKGRPQVAALADNRVVVTVTGGNSQTLAMYYMLVDPSGDAQDGGAAIPANILDVAQTTIGVSTGTGHHAMAVDSAGITHVIKGDNGGNLHIAFNPVTSAIVVAEHAIAGGSLRRDPGFAIDSNDNLHVVIPGVDIDGNGPAAYMMLDNAGAILIDQTQLFEGAAIFPHSAHFSLAIDSDDNVRIVYGDKRNTIDAANWSAQSSSGDAFYVKLDPSADDQDGNAAVLDDIRVDDEKHLGSLWYGRAFLRSGTMYFFGGGNRGRGDFYLRRISGGGSVSGTRIYDASVGGQNWSKHYPAQAGSKLIFAEDAFSPTLVGGTSQLVMTSFGEFDDDDSGSPGLPLLLVLGLAGIARVLRARR